MTHRVMTPDAGKRLPIGVPMNIGEWLDRLDDGFVTAAAGVFGDSPVSIVDLNRFVEPPSRESEGMVPAIERLGGPFPQEIVGGVAVVARCYGVMGGLGPGVVVVLHHMAVRAGLWIVGQVGPTLRVDEGVAPNASRNPYDGAGDETDDDERSHFHDNAP